MRVVATARYQLRFMPVRGWFQVDSGPVTGIPHVHTVDKDKSATQAKTYEEVICDE